MFPSVLAPTGAEKSLPQSAVRGAAGGGFVFPSYPPGSLMGLPVLRWTRRPSYLMPAVTTAAVATSLAAQFAKANSEWLDRVSLVGRSVTNKASWQGWVYANSFDTYGGISAECDAYVGKSWVFAHEITSAGKLAWVQSDSSYGECAGIATGGWHQVAWTFDGTASGNANRLQIYIDGSSQALTFSGTIDSQLNNTGQAYNLGRIGGLANSFWDGLIQGAGYYEDAKTAGEISTLYNAGAGQLYAAATHTNLVAWHDLGEVSGTRADSTANGNTMSDNNSVTSATGHM